MLISREAFVAVLTFMDSKTGQEAEAWRVTFQLSRLLGGGGAAGSLAP